jgi:hypothetical protein
LIIKLEKAGCIINVYIGAPYAFNNISITFKNKIKQEKAAWLGLDTSKDDNWWDSQGAQD